MKKKREKVIRTYIYIIFIYFLLYILLYMFKNMYLHTKNKTLINKLV